MHSENGIVRGKIFMAGVHLPGIPYENCGYAFYPRGVIPQPPAVAQQSLPSRSVSLLPVPTVLSTSLHSPQSSYGGNNVSALTLPMSNMSLAPRSSISMTAGTSLVPVAKLEALPAGMVHRDTPMYSI